MADIMDVDDDSVKELHEIAMPTSVDNGNNERWCLDCAFDAGQRVKERCKCPPEEGAAGLFTSELENNKRRICRRMDALKNQMVVFKQRYGGQERPGLPEVIRYNKYQQQLLNIHLLATLRYTNDDDLLHDEGERELTVRKHKRADGKVLLAIGIKSLGLWIDFDTDLDTTPRLQKAAEFMKKPRAKSHKPRA